MKHQAMSLIERAEIGAEKLSFRVLYLFAYLFGDWDRTWTEDSRLCSVFGFVGVEHRAHDGLCSYAFDRGGITNARKVADALAHACEQAWARRVGDFELLSGLRHTTKLMQRFGDNKAVMLALEQTLEVIYEEVLIRGIQIEAKKARLAA